MSKPHEEPFARKVWTCKACHCHLWRIVVGQRKPYVCAACDTEHASDELVQRDEPERC